MTERNPHLYQVRFTHYSDGSRRMSHVKAFNLSEANAKAKRFVIKGGSIISVLEVI